MELVSCDLLTPRKPQLAALKLGMKLRRLTDTWKGELHSCERTASGAVPKSSLAAADSLGPEAGCQERAGACPRAWCAALLSLASARPSAGADRASGAALSRQTIVPWQMDLRLTHRA